MAQFDDLVAKYRNLTYGRLASNNPSAIKSLLETTDKSISNPQYFGNIDPRQQQYLDTPSGLIAQNRFRIDPETGIPIFETPASESIKSGSVTSGSGTYDPNIDYGDPGYAGVIPVDPLIGTDPVPTFASPERGGGGQRLGSGTVTAEDQGYGYSGTPGEGGSATYNNPTYGSSLLGTGTGDTFTPGPGIGKAYDEYGRLRDIGIPQDIGLNMYNAAFPVATAATEVIEKLPSINILKTLFGTDKPEDKPTDFDSGYESSYDPNKPGSGGYKPDPKPTPDTRPPDQIGGGGDGGGSTPSSGPSGDDAATGKDSGMPAGDSGDKPRDGGNPGGNPSKKIVCTMMNESYGFGSFRNAIWLKYAKDNLSPEYQIGYHKLFLPLVKYAKGNNKSNLLVKHILEHIAIHRTIDLKQQMRNNKRHTLGRIYRAILEPLCYIVGKYGK
jgi:hypothetical protein